MSQESIGTARLDLVVEMAQFDTAISAAKRSVSGMSQSAQAEYAKLSAAERRRVDGLLRQADTIELTRKQQILYNAAMRDLPTSILDELKTKLLATGAAAAGAGKQLNQYGVSAAQQAAALRGVPAQLTDIVVSLQGGQQPLTVLLQQGGQLKDMFGGIVPAAKALGGAVMGLVNPFTLTAAAVALLGVAYKQGSGEADTYRKALAETGNIVGLNAAAMGEMARQMKGVTGTQGRAAEALAVVATTGKVARGSLQEVAEAASGYSRTMGKDLGELSGQFAKLADSPAEAAAKLNEQYHFLTAAVYEQIRALDEQGRKEEAADLAQRTFASALKTRTAAVKAEMGSLERGWESLGKVARGAWDAMLNVGRPTPIEDLRKQAAALEKAKADLEKNGGFAETEGGAATGGGSARGRAAMKRIAAELAAVQQEISNRDKAAADARAAGLKQQGEDAKIAGRIALESYLDARRGNSLSRAIEDENKAFARATKEFSKDSDEYREALKTHNSKVDELRKQDARKAGTYKDDGATKLLAEYAQAEAALRGQLETQEKLGNWEKKRLAFEQEIADLKVKKTLTADQKSLLAQEEQLRAALQKVAATEKEVRLAREAAQIETLRASLSSSRAVEQRQYADQVAGIGLGDRAQDELRARQAIIRDYQNQLDRATRDHTLGKVSDEAYKSETQLLEEHLAKRLEMQQAYFSQVRQAQGDWSNGAKSALQNYLESASDVAGQSKTLFSSAFQGMEDAIVKFATTGKLSFADMTRSILADMARIAARQALVGLGTSLFGAMFSGFSASTVGGSMTGDVGGMSGSWGAVAGARASGGPTAPNSLYRVNELGPELYSEGGKTYLMSGGDGGFVTPLRNSVPGAAPQAGGNVSNVIVNITNNGAATQATGSDEFTNDLADKIRALVQSEMQKAYTKQGGLRWQEQNRRIPA